MNLTINSLLLTRSLTDNINSWVTHILYVYIYIRIHTHTYTRFSSVAQSCLTLCNPMDCSMPSFPVHHQLLEPTQTHVHWVGDAFQSSHPLSSPSPPAFNLSQHQGLFFTNILSDSVGSLFVDGCFLFDKVSFVYFTFNFLAKEDMSKKALLRPMLNPLLLMFF